MAKKPRNHRYLCADLDPLVTEDENGCNEVFSAPNSQVIVRGIEMKTAIAILFAGTAILSGCAAPIEKEPELIIPDEGGNILPPAGLTGEEKGIWNTLTDSAKREALIFIVNGGTLKQFVAV